MGDRVSASQQKSSSQSIFREKSSDTVTVTPSSSTSTSPRRSRHKAKYDELLPSRYYENDNRLSWEFEENPPIEEAGDEQKRLSDNLFSLSREVPQLTDEVAAVLREAQEKDLWDLAVAELMPQVVAVVHCQDGDSRFDGLPWYMLTLVISC